MAIVYYSQPGATTQNDEPTNPPLTPPFVQVTQTVYQQDTLAIYQSIGLDALKIKASRSKTRVNSFVLDNGAITTDPHAFYLEDIPLLGYTQVDWDIDTVFHNSELGAPWDYDGTDGFGFANRVSLTPGSHTINATVTSPGGSFIVSAVFDCD